MTEMTTVDTLHGEALARAADQAVRAIPPAWPLTATVAVNPFLGQISETLDHTAARLARIGGVRLALPRRHYTDLIAKARSRTTIWWQHSIRARCSTASICRR